jgi:predicted site-specific integrase-resolvase
METDTVGLLNGYLTTSIVAAELAVHWRTLKRWLVSGYGPPYVRVGRRIYYRRADVTHWLENQTAERARRPKRVRP